MKLYHYDLLEMISSPHYNQKADIYSFAISFFEVLTCLKPFKNHKDELRNSFMLYNSLMNGLRPGPLPREPQKVMTLISNCWKTDPTMRPTAKEISEELKEIRSQRYYFPCAIVIKIFQ